MLPAEQDGQPDPEPVLPGHFPTQVYYQSVQSFNDEARTNSSYTIANDSTGKQVVDVGHDGLQVDGSSFGSTHEIGRKGVGLEVVSVAPNEKEVLTRPQPATKHNTRKKLLLAAAVGLVVLIAAAVVGGVLGSRKANGSTSSSEDEGQTSPTSTSSAATPTETSIATLSSIKKNSNLAVAAWRKSSGLQIFLYYQNQNGSLRWSTYDDTQSSFTYNGSYWGDSTEIVMESSDSVANDTSFGAGILLWDTTYEPQIELFYLDTDHNLRGVYNMNDATSYDADSVDNSTAVAADGSSLASYWPYCAYINENEEVSVVGNVPYSETRLSPTSNWTVTSLAQSAMPGSKLAIVPLVANMDALLDAGGYGVFYQDTGGKLAYIQPNRDAAAANSTLVDSWPTEAEFPSITLAAGGSFAAFTTARSDSSQGRVNTYVLYQETSSRISMVYLNNDSDWVISQPESMSTADNGTDIACLTMPMTQSDDDGTQLDLEEASSHANRCYFQRGGYVREFALSGTDWIELGTIPMD